MYFFVVGCARVKRGLLLKGGGGFWSIYDSLKTFYDVLEQENEIYE